MRATSCQHAASIRAVWDAVSIGSLGIAGVLSVSRDQEHKLEGGARDAH